MIRTQLALGIAAGGVTMALLAGGPALASRCGEQNPPRCGLDSQTEPPDPALGGTGGCTDASMVGLPMYNRTGTCRPGDTMVIYDIGGPFPDNGVPFDEASVAGKEASMPADSTRGGAPGLTPRTGSRTASTENSDAGRDGRPYLARGRLA